MGTVLPAVWPWARHLASGSPFLHLQNGHRGPCRMGLCEPSCAGWCGPSPSIAPAQSPRPGTEQALGRHSVDGRQGCGLNTAEDWISVSVTSRTRASGLDCLRVPLAPDSDCLATGSGPSVCPLPVSLQLLGSREQEEGSWEADPQETDGRPLCRPDGPSHPHGGSPASHRHTALVRALLSVPHSGHCASQSLTGEEGTTIQSNWPR